MHDSACGSVWPAVQFGPDSEINSHRLTDFPGPNGKTHPQSFWMFLDSELVGKIIWVWVKINPPRDRRF